MNDKLFQLLCWLLNISNSLLYVIFNYLIVSLYNRNQIYIYSYNQQAKMYVSARVLYHSNSLPGNKIRSWQLITSVATPLLLSFESIYVTADTRTKREFFTV